VVRRKLLYLCLWLTMAGFLPEPVPAATPASGLGMTACRLEHPLKVRAIAAECGTLSVPEDRARPHGRQVALFVARVPALSRRRVADPLFIVAGGPGLGAATFYASVAPAFERIHRDRDIVLVDQRGTGNSNPLNCPFEEQQMWDASEDEVTRVMRACRDRLALDHDLAQYTTSVAIVDLDAVRTALGYATVNLYGSSYGTRVAQHYARRYPQQTRAVILDGAVPPGRILGTTTPLDAQSALQKTFARCREDVACIATFGDPEADYTQLRDKLKTSAIPISITDPHSGRPQQLLFTGSVLAGALRLLSYNADQAALLPLSLHLANKEGQFTALASQFLITAASYDSVLAYGMHNSVVCSEDVPYFSPHNVDRDELAQTFLGLAQLDALQSLCKDWPRGPMDADLHQPLASQVPALVLSGTADPVTPDAFGTEATRGFANALHLKLEDQGHGQLAQPCVDKLMAQFLATAVPGKVPKLDASCVGKLRPPAFFLSLSGAGP
jgi:pimeloyl-ACP methyl ester carboxylesterase